MRFDWDNHKSHLLKQNSGYSLEEVATILAGDYVERIKRDDPRTIYCYWISGKYPFVGHLRSSL